MLRTLEMGGIQRWVASLAGAAHETGIDLDVLYLLGPADRNVLRSLDAANCRVWGPAPSSYNIGGLFSFVRRLAREHGPYQAVHAHLYYNAGVILAMFRSCGVPVRIHHVHSIMDRPDMRLGKRNWRWWVRPGLQRLIDVSATHRLAVSEQSGRSMHGPRWGEGLHDAVVPPGVEVPEIISEHVREHLRREIGIPVGAKVIGHIGRFVDVKNYPKVLDVFATYARHHGDARLVLVGDGPLRTSIEARATSLGIRDRVTLTGIRADATRLLQLFDVMLLPSISESFSLTAAEAISVGVPVVASDGVPAETFPAELAFLRQRLPLTAADEEWSSAIRRALTVPRDPDQAAALFSSTRLGVRHGAEALARLYRGEH